MSFVRPRHGRMRMCDGPGKSALPPIQYGDIIFAEIPDPNGANPKVRRLVVLTGWDGRTSRSQSM